MLPPTTGGGPHGVGDPEDRTLRKVETEVLIPKKIREKTKDQKCILEGQAFSKCCKAAGLLMTFTCRRETKILNECLEKWYHDDNFRQMCTEEYLAERAEYRRTGLTQKERRKESAMF